MNLKLYVLFATVEKLWPQPTTAVVNGVNTGLIFFSKIKFCWKTINKIIITCEPTMLLHIVYLSK